MRRITALAGMVLLATTLAIGCGQQAEEQAAQTEPASEVAATAEAKPYPFDFCMVSGEKLGSMGEPSRLVWEGQEVKFCCDGCIPEFKEHTAKYLAMIANPAATLDSLGGDDDATGHEGHDHGDG